MNASPAGGTGGNLDYFQTRSRLPHARLNPRRSIRLSGSFFPKISLVEDDGATSPREGAETKIKNRRKERSERRGNEVVVESGETIERSARMRETKRG